MSEFIDTLLTQARATLGTHEEGGKNRGGSIDTWNRGVGAPLGSPWCASWAWSMFRDACALLGVSNPCPKTASSHAMWTMADPDKRTILPAPGDLYVLDHGDGKGHVGIVESVTPAGQVATEISGNTNEAGSREGNAVVRHSGPPERSHGGTLLGFVNLDPTQTPEYQAALARGELA